MEEDQATTNSHRWAIHNKARLKEGTMVLKAGRDMDLKADMGLKEGMEEDLDMAEDMGDRKDNT